MARGRIHADSPRSSPRDRRARRADPIPWAFAILFLFFLVGAARAETDLIDPVSGAALRRPEALPTKAAEPAPAPSAPAALEETPPAYEDPESPLPEDAYEAPAYAAPRPARRAAPAPREEQALDAPSRIERIWEESRQPILAGNQPATLAASAAIRGLMDDAGIGGLPAHGSALLVAAAAHAERGNYPAARALAEAAAEIAPTSPEAWREWGRYLVKSRSGQLWTVAHAWAEYGRALLASPAHLASLLGNLLFYGLAAALLVGAVIFTRPAARGFLIWNERLRERLPETFPAQARVALLAGVFLFPLVFPGGLGWLFLAVLFLVSPHMGRAERLGFGLALLTLAAAGPVARFCSSFDAFMLRPRMQILAEATRAEWTPRSLARIDAELRLHGDDAALWGAKGLYEKFAGRPAEAEAAYRRALQLSPGAAFLHNNLANLLLGREEYAEAGEHYRRAAAFAPRSAAVQFNLSQYYRSQMLFAEGEAAFRQAKGLDPDLVGNVVFRTTSRETRNTVDLPMDAAEWRGRFLEDSLERDRLADDLWKTLFPFAPLWAAPGVGLLAAGLLMLQLRQDLRARSALCHRCGVVMEIPYKKREEARQTCPSCRALADHPRDLAPELRGRQLRRIERFQSLKRRLLRWGALTLPGSAHWMGGEALRGAAMLAVFFLLLMKWIAWEGRFRFAPWPRAEGLGPEFLPFLTAMGVLYYASFLKVRKL